jgi:DNA-binding GntR family transcriptional regulator
VSAEDMREIYEVLTALESQASHRLAERRPSREEIKPLIDAAEEMEAALAAKDLERWAVADGDFHRSLLELCGNKRMAQIAQQTFDQVHRARMVTLRLRPFPTKSNRDHRELVEAILAGDGEKAYEIHHRHRDQAMMMLVDILERYQIEEL